MRTSAFLVLTAFLLAGLSTAYRQQQRNSQQQWSQEDSRGAKPFRQGHSYVFTYNGQIASGLDTNGIGQATDEPQQKAVTRLQAEAHITFESNDQATLHLQQVRVGQLNKHIETPQQVQPMEMFENKHIQEEKQRQLELPVQFQYQQGVVRNIHFSVDDDTWSKNIKRSVLNLIQLNLKGQQQQPMEQEQSQEQESRSSSNQKSRSFTLPEITIEGECQTTYTINKNSRQISSQQSQEQDEQQELDRESLFNVTKSINFKQCTKVADIGFGFQTEQHQQPQCQKCREQWQQKQQGQYRGAGEQGQQQPNPCPECDPKEVKEQTLERSTIIRFVLNGQPESYAIKRTELVSQYLYKNLRVDNGEYSSAMQTIVCAELIFRKEQQANGQQQQRQQGQYSQGSDNKKNTLLYDNEWDVEVKNFYMNGDDGFGRNSPFARVPNKVDQAMQILRRLVQAASDKTQGIEFEQLVYLQKLIDLFRQCSVEELKQIHNAALQGKHSQQQQSQNGQGQLEKQKILLDTLAMAGTRNTIFLLAQKISNGEVKPVEAVQSLKSLTGLVAPSDKQAKIVLNLCKNEAVHRSSALKQTCWLTFGSLVGELCQQKNGQQQQKRQTYGSQNGFQPMEEMCSQENRQTYKEALVKQFEQAETTYEKVLSLKALGNAGISITRLEQIIHQKGEDRLVRIQAIDALRRLRHQMPKKIQRVLLPIFQNTKEHQEVRMAAFAMIMRTQPEEHIVDQLSYTLIKERNAQVQSFVYTTMVALSKSKLPAEQQIAKHLKSTLKLANVDEQVLRSSRKYRLPIYSNEQQEGIFLNLVSVFNSRSMLPSHVSASVDSILNEQYQKDTVKLGFNQRGMEQWYETLVNNLMKMVNEEEETGYGKTRGERPSTSTSQNNRQQLKDMFNGLKIQKRQSSYYRMDQEESFRPTQSNEPFAMICLRVGDVDQVILPIERHSAPECLRKLLKGERQSLAQWIQGMNGEQQHFRFLGAWNLNEKSAKIPTSLGVPLQILQSMPLLASIDGSFKVERQGAIKAQVNVHPSICAAHIQKMECWTPIIATGVGSIRALELNVPVQIEIQASREHGIKLALKVPQTPKTRVLGVHTLPVTYTREWDTKTKQLREPKVKSIHNPQLEQLQRDATKKIGEHTFGLPLTTRGHFHFPAQFTDYQQVAQLVMATENHVHVYFEPIQGQSPKKIVFQINGQTFQKKERNSHGPELDNFYSQNNRFQRAYPEDNFEDMNLDGHERSKQKLNSYLNNFQPQMYEHTLKASVHTEGGRKEIKGEVRLNGACDQKVKFCRLSMEVKRSPLLAQENQEWTMSSKIQVLTPDAVSSVGQLGQSGEKNQKFILQTENQWGSDRKQSINFRIQGEQGQNGQHRQQIGQFQGAQSKYQQKRAAFLNKFDVVVDYKLRPEAQNFFARGYEVVKARNYWSTQSLLQHSGNDGQCHATIVIDPIGQKSANVSVKTPTEAIRMLQVQLPTPIRPFSLIRAGDKSTHSPSQLFKRMAVGGGRAECTVDGKRVNTFDEVLYKAPIGKCYSVLAKDCSSETPRFVVMMKSINGQDKKIKIVTPEQTITCQPQQQSQEKRLECKVNGQVVNGQEQSQDHQVVEFNNDEQTDVTINVEGVQVRFGCWCNSCKCQKAWIKISQQYKENQCGLCGHYDDQAGDELRMNDNQLTDDVGRFHRSYTLQDNEDECSNEEQEKFYGQKNQFQQIGSNEQQQYRQKKALSDYEQEDQEDEWLAGAYHSDDSQDDSQWGRQQKWDSNKRWQQKQQWQGKNGQRKGQQQDQEEQDAQEPIEQTKVLEYNHRICFSVTPVKQCPEGTTPSQDNNQEDQKKKVQFTCLERSDSNARRLQRQARRGVVVQLDDQSPSFVEAIAQPSSCLAY